MNELFLKIINMSISAGWLVLAVRLLRPCLLYTSQDKVKRLCNDMTELLEKKLARYLNEHCKHLSLIHILGMAETIHEDGFHINLDDLYSINSEEKSILIRKEERSKP